MMENKIMLLLLFSVHLLYSQNWEPIAGGVSRHVRALYGDTIDNVLYLAGTFVNADGVEANGVAGWDGAVFFQLAEGSDDCTPLQCPISFTSIMRYKGEIYFAYSGYSVGGVQTKGVAKWNGIEWDSVGTGIKSSDGSGGQVWDMMVYEDELYLFGRFTFAGTDTSYAAAKWNGGEYVALGFPYVQTPSNNPPLILEATVFNEQIYVGGQFADGFGVENQLDVARFDGENWHPVGDRIKGAIGDVDAIIVYKNELYIGGNFRRSLGNEGNGIMKLKGSKWVDVGGSFDEETVVVQDMVVYHDELYVFGVFHSVGGGVRADNVAKWDGGKWCGLGGDFNQRIEKAVAFKDTLFVGGWFHTIDSDSFLYIAKWSGDYVDTCGAIILAAEEVFGTHAPLKIFPNPASEKITMNFSLGLPYENARLKVFNNLGIVVFRSKMERMAQQIQINTSNWPPGLYFATLEVGGQVWVEKVVVR